MEFLDFEKPIAELKAKIDALQAVEDGSAVDIQEERVLSRPNMTKEKLEKIIAEQIPNDVKKKKADFIIDTSISIEDARIQIENLIKKIKN